MVQSFNRPHRNVGLELFSPIQSIPEDEHNGSQFPNFNKNVTQNSSVPYGIDDVSTWIGGKLKLVQLYMQMVNYRNIKFQRHFI